MRILRVILAGVLYIVPALAGGCASAGGAVGDGDFELVPGTTYSFSGSLPGVHVYGNRRVDFTVPVNGDLLILSGTSAALLSSHGACGDGATELRMSRRGRTWTFECPRIRLELTPAGDATLLMVSASIEQEYEAQGECLVWNTDPATGRRTSCAERAQVVGTRRIMSGPVAVSVRVH